MCIVSDQTSEAGNVNGRRRPVLVESNGVLGGWRVGERDRGQSVARFEVKLPPY
jgi:hypothetical protein